MVRWLLHNSDPTAVAAYRGVPVETLEVVGGCDCGCCSIDFSTNTADAEIITDALAVYPDGQEAELILWGRNGELVGLEIHDKTPGASERMPQLANLRTWEQRGRELAEGGTA